MEGHPPFQGDTVSETLQAILIGKIEYKYASPEAQQFIGALLTADPTQRLGNDIRSIRNHPVGTSVH